MASGIAIKSARPPLHPLEHASVNLSINSLVEILKKACFHFENKDTGSTGIAEWVPKPVNIDFLSITPPQNMIRPAMFSQSGPPQRVEYL